MTPRKQIAAVLARLSLHYWRPDYSPEQARLLMEDYLSDLSGYSPAQVERACAEYRQNPANKFFPHSGELLGLMGHGKTEYRSRLPTHRATPALTGPRAPVKSVAQVLREHGMTAAAKKWDAPNYHLSGSLLRGNDAADLGSGI